jgi:hypothetical protein
LKSNSSYTVYGIDLKILFVQDITGIISVIDNTTSGQDITGIISVIDNTTSGQDIKHSHLHDSPFLVSADIKPLESESDNFLFLQTLISLFTSKCL